MALPSGTRLGPYEIVSPLGAGGMGEVYRARDTHLARDVALKLLRPELALDADAIARFEAEARTASSLNHPHIVHVYDIGKAATPIGLARYIAMELVAGETLRARLERGDRWPHILELLVQVADALGKAHRAGIVHRDLKPENIMVAADGYAKVVDFGIAKLTEDARAAGESDETRVAVRTETGTVVGTVGYMSPEQAEGRPTDARSDVFSFGCILFEAIAGRQPFNGVSALATLHAIRYEPAPALTALVPAVPSKLARVTATCLEKDPQHRFQSIGDAAAELRAFIRAHPAPDANAATAVVPQQAPRWFVNRAALAWTLAAVAAAVGATLVGTRIGLAPKPDGESSSLPMRVEQVTSRGRVGLFAIAPDGRYLAYVAPDRGRSVLWLRDLIEKTEKALVDSPEPFRDAIRFASDGRSVYYWLRKQGSADSSLYRAPLVAGEPRLIRTASALRLSPNGAHVSFERRSAERRTLLVAGAEAVAESEVGDVTGGGALGWSHDGRLLYRKPVEGGQGLFVVNSDGAGEKRIATVARAPVHAWWNPAGTHAILDVPRPSRGVQLVSLDMATGATMPVGDRTWSQVDDLIWLPDGRAFVASDFPEEGMSLWRVTYPAGRALRVPNNSRLHYRLSMSADGSKLATIEQLDRPELLVSTGPTYGEFRKAISGTNSIPYDLCWTAGGRIVFSSNEAGSSDLYAVNADGSGRKQLTFDRPGNEVQPSATPDGRYIVFASDRSGDFALYRINADGSGVTALTSPQPGRHDRDPHVTADSKWIVYRHIARDKGPTLWKVSIDGGAPTPVRGAQTAGANSDGRDEYAWGGSLSPDGAQLAFFRYSQNAKMRQFSPVEIAVSDADGRILHRLPIRERPVVRSEEWVQWSADGRHIYYLSEDARTLWKQPLAGGRGTEAARSDEGVMDYELSSDGKSLAFSRSSSTRDVVLMTNFR